MIALTIGLAGCNGGGGGGGGGGGTLRPSYTPVIPADGIDIAAGGMQQTVAGLTLGTITPQ